MATTLDAARQVLSGDPGSLPMDEVTLTSRRLIVGVTVLANVIGAAVVVVLLSVVLPVPQEADPADGLVWIGAAYLVAALAVGVWRGIRLAAPVIAYFADDCPPDEDARGRVLRLPLQVFALQAALWALAALLHGALALTVSALFGFEVALVIAAAGVATAGIAYLQIGRILRGSVAVVLASAPPREREVAGIGARAVITWAITAVPVAGIVVLAVFGLALDTDGPALARGALGLAVVALAVGALAMVTFARSLAEPLERLRDAISEVEAGDFDTEVPVHDATEVGYAIAGFNRMAAGLRERERLRDLFGRQVGEDVARRALEQGVTLGGEEREAAALFVDIVGSTTFAAESEPGEVVEALNRFFAVVVEVTGEFGGLVNKFAGDAALCVFGAPLGQEDPAGCALGAARAMARRLGEELDDLGAGIGVSAGTVVAGNVGTADRYEYTVIGDPVNEAARLTELAKQREPRVLASGAAVERARDDEAGHWSPAGDEVLRGRREPTRLHTPTA